MLFRSGKEYASRMTGRLQKVAEKFAIEHGRTAKLMSIYDPDHEASRVYTAMKAKKAGEIGVAFENVDYRGSNIEEAIEQWNKDETVDGIMVQTPLPNDQYLIEQIAPNKDVDGMRTESPYLPATVRAVFEILDSTFEIRNIFHNPSSKIVIVGSRGRVGGGVVARLHQLGAEQFYAMDSDSFDLEKLSGADVVVSAAGVPGLVTADMVKVGVVAIDVGYPAGDFAAEVAEKAVFFTPVPGGVGPVTVVSLFGNLDRKSVV